MHIITDVQKRVQDFVSENATTLLTAGGIVGTISTGVLAFRGGMKYEDIRLDKIDELNAGLDLEDEQDRDRYVTVNTVPTLTKMQWMAPHLVPPVLIGGATIATIVFSHKMTAQKAAALAAAYGLSQKQFEEYKDKVAEKLTGPKKQAIEDELSQERVSNAPGSQNIVIINGDDVLCFDEPTGRFFKSTMEKINSAVNATNQEIINHGCARASFFYEELEMPATTWASDVGWNMDNMCDISVSTTQAEDGRPCLSINFAKFPIEDYHRTLY